MSATMKLAAGTFWRASRTWVSEMSTPTTSNLAARRLVYGTPAPQPRSSTRARSGSVATVTGGVHDPAAPVQVALGHGVVAAGDKLLSGVLHGAVSYTHLTLPTNREV